MAIYVVAPRTGIVKESYERSLSLVLASDAREAEKIPPPFRMSAEILWTEELAKAFSGAVPNGTDGVIVYLEGERQIHGEPVDIRRSLLQTPGKTSLVAVHLPGIPGADLISIQPRTFAPGVTKRSLNPSWRLQGTPALSTEARAALNQLGEPWAQLYLGLHEEMKSPGASLESLKKLSRTPKLEPTLAALTLRNLIVVLLRKKDFAKAEELLKLGIEAYPDYADLWYLAGLMWVERKKLSNAIRPLEQAMACRSTGFVGSGGENSYRASWLLAVVHDFAGNQQKAVACCAPGLWARPAFTPAVDLFLKQRMAPEIVAAYRIPLGFIARNNPAHFEPVLDFFISHRSFELARVLLDTSAISSAARDVLEDRLDRAEGRFRSRRQDTADKPGVILRGPFLMHSGHARINREIGKALLASDDLDAALEPQGWGYMQPFLLPQGAGLRKAMDHVPNSVDLTIRHQWPPYFRRPRAGKLACILPWEHDAVPQRWVEKIEENVDELWVPSNFVRSAFVHGGVEADRAFVVPNGVNCNVFSPKGKSRRPNGAEGFVFLYVGGTIARKGIDLLLQAYGDAFLSDDDVTLVIKDVGSSSFYQNNNMLGRISSFISQPSSPRVVTISQNLDDSELADLYRGCDAFVLPYRGEGFGMPILEAIACGKPVIVTGEGPAPEFCSADTGYLIPAREVAITEPPPPLGKFTSEWTWFEPDVKVLAETMRHVFENRDEAMQRGRSAAERVARTLTWDHVTKIYLERIARLTQMEPSAVFAGEKVSV